jgi:hypothetical protein
MQSKATNHRITATTSKFVNESTPRGYAVSWLSATIHDVRSYVGCCENQRRRSNHINGLTQLDQFRTVTQTRHLRVSFVFSATIVIRFLIVDVIVENMSVNIGRRRKVAKLHFDENVGQRCRISLRRELEDELSLCMISCICRH